VLAADIVTADVHATAIVAGGEPMRNQYTASCEIEVLGGAGGAAGRRSARDCRAAVIEALSDPNSDRSIATV